MLRNTFQTLGAITLLFILVTSCKKKNDQKSKTELITQKPWVFSKYEEKVNNGAFIDDFPSWVACEKDDKYTFKTNNIVDYDPLVKCDPSDVATQISWAFTDNETKLVFLSGSNVIDLLDENNLVVSEVEVISGVTYTTKITLRHP